MSFSFGHTSRMNLSTCHADLQDLFHEVIKHYDCKVMQGHRPESEQNLMYVKGRSKLKWPDSKHNKKPSRAADVYPYPIQLPQPDDSEGQVRKKLARFYHFAGFVKATALQMGIDIRAGCDWDSDHDFSDQSFDDLPHFELL